MEIKFKSKELKNDTLELTNIDYCYLTAIKNSNPIIWASLKKLIKRIDMEES